jgi:predicted transcriptional regulator
MARKRIGMKKIREIIRFRETTDMSERRTARALNISRPVAAQYIRDFNASDLTCDQIKDMQTASSLPCLKNKRTENAQSTRSCHNSSPIL